MKDYKVLFIVDGDPDPIKLRLPLYGCEFIEYLGGDRWGITKKPRRLIATGSGSPEALISHLEKNCIRHVDVTSEEEDVPVDPQKLILANRLYQASRGNYYNHQEY